MNEPYAGGGVILYGAPETIFFASFPVPGFISKAIFNGVPITSPLTDNNDGKTERPKIAEENSSFRPVSFVSVVELRQGKSEQLRSLVAPGSTCRFFCGRAGARYINEDCIEFNSGEILVSSSKKVSVVCGSKKLELDADCICLIKKELDRIEITVLHDRRRNSVRISGSEFFIQCGEQAILSPAKHKYADGLAKRRSQRLRFGNQQAIELSEVSFTTVAQESDLLMGIIHAQTSAERSLKRKCLKAAACLSIAKSTHGPYSSGNQSSGH